MVTSNHQVTIPRDVFEAAGFEQGDVLVVRCDGPGKLVVERQRDVIAELAGSIAGMWEPGFVDRLRGEWD